MSNLGVGMIIIWCVTIIGVKKRHFDLMSGASPSGKGMLYTVHNFAQLERIEMAFLTLFQLIQLS